MYCSDGSSRYFTDEQFQDPKVGFTHASEDYCAVNGQGTMVALADVPQATYSASGLTESYVEAMEKLAEIQAQLREGKYGDSGSIELFESSTTDNGYLETEEEKAAREKAAEQARVAAQSACRDKAVDAMNSVRRQIGALGAGGSSAAQTAASEAYDSTYRSCMRERGY